MSDSDAQDMSGRQRLVVSVWIVLNVAVILLWVFPFGTPLRQFIAPYLSVTGLRQNWSLFAPDPMSTNSYVDAEVVMENGDVRVWGFPQLQSMGFQERYGKARYRKFTGWLYRDEYSYAWRDTARYIARQFKDSAVPPQSVHLLRHWSRIPPINARHEAESEWRNAVFFVYQIAPEDLQ
jgi:hypothetical protein